MGLFKFAKYSYTETYEGQNKQLIVKLTEEYEPLFLEVLDHKLPQEKEALMYKGVESFTQYMLKGVFYKMRENYNSKSPLEKKYEALYNRLVRYYDNLEEEFQDIVRDSIYDALGLITDNKKFKPEGENTYIIKYMQTLVFFNTLNYMEKQLNALESTSNEVVTEDKSEKTINDIDIDNLLNHSKLKGAIAEDLFIELRETLINNEEPSPYLKPYLEILLKEKEEYDKLHN